MKRSFYYYWFASTNISLADVIYIMVITTFIYRETQSAFIAALFPLFNAISRFTAGFTTPLLLEKFQYAHLLVSLQIIKAVLITFLIIGFDPITSHIVFLILFVLVISFIEGWGSPLLQSVVPRIVSKSELIKANSSLSITNQSVQIAGYTFTGFLVIQFGHMPTLITTAILLWLASISLYQTSRSFVDEQRVENRKSRWALIKEGWSLLWNNHTLRMVTIMDIIEGMAGTIWIGAITLVYVKEALNQSEEWWGFINSSYYIGTILGGFMTFWMAKWIQKHLIASMIIGSAFFSLFTLLYGLNSIPILSLILCVGMGPAYQLRDVAQQTAIQTGVDSSLLPKLYASRSIISSTVTSLSIAIVGLIADFLGIRWVYIFGSILIATSAFLALAIIRYQKNLKQAVPDASLKT
ncbi:MFS transporter [Fictibacillus nanhaiensis]|uniref:MFS transporter n=1 Tax=Fictibacillus nanhaiensis TaxID=742169 RepID=UPI001C9433FC|nr:MFS transporter [Fictibacillus nanhaiensis]MBY6038053.1 MFS transporter [Fictibacillus nanhaiensis]